MKANHRFLIAIAVLGLLMTGPFVLTAIILFADLSVSERTALIDVLLPRLPVGVGMTLFGFILGVQVLRHLFRQYVKGLLRMAEQLRLMLGANRNFRIAVEGPPEVGEVARAANNLAQQRDTLISDVDRQITQAKASVEAEKNRLSALMSQLALGVVVCNMDGRILLYNNRARLLFKSLAQGPTSMTGGALIGLGRSIFSILEQAQISHALEHIQHRIARGSAEPVANFIISSRSGQLMRTQMAPVIAAPANGVETGQITGYVLTVENITRSFEQDAERDSVLGTLTQSSRSSLGTVRAASETLLDNPDMEIAMREQLLRIIAEEASAMGRRIDETMNEFADSLKTRWPLEEVLGMDLVATACRRIESRLPLLTKTEDLDDTLWVRADSFALLQAITFLASRLQDHYDIRELRLRLTREGKMAFFDLIWTGQPVSSETLYSWELESMTVGDESMPLTLRDVLERHSGEIWYQRDKTAYRAYFRLVIPVAENPGEQAVEAETGNGASSRPEFYDFDLFNFHDHGIDLDRKLSDLTYSVFDTETTGLQPSAGDEIIQIGAIRVLNGRLLRQEIIDQIIDPGWPLKPEGIPIHGITEDMVRGQPTIDTVLPAFHAFCAETVLVAHNAAFDLRFLQLKEESTGITFSQPVLDTLLLSAVIHPNQESHRLESIAERLGIVVSGRHTALGDAIVTGEIFLKMIPLLADMGIVTLRQALDAAQQTYFARVKY